MAVAVLQRHALLAGPCYATYKYLMVQSAPGDSYQNSRLTDAGVNVFSIAHDLAAHRDAVGLIPHLPACPCSPPVSVAPPSSWCFSTCDLSTVFRIPSTCMFYMAPTHCRNSILIPGGRICTRHRV